MSRPLGVLFAPDSFKGSLTSVEVASALAAGWSRARPMDRVELAPLADGGEGTLAAMAAAGGWKWREVDAHDPLGRPVRARWLLAADRSRAAVELASASGISRVAAAERDAARASTLGTGEVLRAVLDEGIRRIVLGLGGSATTDGGAGLLRALGASIGEDLDTVDLAGLDPRLSEVELWIANDVSNPLLGPAGAAAVYGPQKGTSPDQVGRLDARLARFADALEAAAGRRERDTPGAGAAGGTTFALLCLRDRFRSLELASGIDLLIAETNLVGRLSAAHVAVTGEGRIDEQTAFGKTALGVARRAREAGVPCIAVGGGVTPEGIAALAPLGVIVVPVAEAPQSVEEAMAAGTGPLERCGERIARLISLGVTLEVTGATTVG